MNGDNTIEATIDRIAPYIRDRVSGLPVSEHHGIIFPLYELAARTDTNIRMLGKIRKHFKRALSQSLAPGRDSPYQIDEQSFYGRAAFVVRRIK